MSRNHNGKNASSSLPVGAALWRNFFKKPTEQTADRTSALGRIPLFKGLSPTGLDKFARMMHARRFKPGETVFRQGEPGVGMYVILSGTVTFYVSTPERGRAEVARLGRGDYFGELALVDDARRSATAVALDHSEMLVLFLPDLLNLVDRDPRITNRFLFQLLAVVGERLRRTNEEMGLLISQGDQSQIIT